jgi:RHS repeat-associated protein
MITNQYAYNGDGQRVQIVDSQGTKKPIWDGENILLETDGADATQVVYTLEPAGYGNLVSQRRGSTSSYYLFDALGSTRKLTNSAGTVTDSYDFGAWGNTFQSTVTTVNVFRWVGELGYYYDLGRDAYSVRARHYSQKQARFLSVDPMVFVGSHWNLYEYAQSSPVIQVDPSGEAIWIPIIIIIPFLWGCRQPIQRAPTWTPGPPVGGAPPLGCVPNPSPIGRPGNVPQPGGADATPENYYLNCDTCNTDAAGRIDKLGCTTCCADIQSIMPPLLGRSGVLYADCVASCGP